MARTALLIRCTTDEAQRIRIEAEKQRRTISGYVLNVMVRAVDLEERLFSKMNRYSGLNQVLSRREVTAPGPRTAILVRCSVEEAERIRDAARRREIAINAFVLQSMLRLWNVQSAPPTDAQTEASPSIPPIR
jgi:uncharacterized protein (DUF1778 family)